MIEPASFRRNLTRIAAVVGIAISLGGCIVVPGPGYYRPHRYYYY